MSYCRREGKDEIIFATKEDLDQPSKALIKLDDDEEEEPVDVQNVGLVLPSGEINWNCPCLGGMASGPCGMQFREAFSCFHFSQAEPKGSDCIDSFRKMQGCMSGYPELYPSKDDEELQDASADNEVAGEMMLMEDEGNKRAQLTTAGDGDNDARPQLTGGSFVVEENKAENTAKTATS